MLIFILVFNFKLWYCWRVRIRRRR